MVISAILGFAAVLFGAQGVLTPSIDAVSTVAYSSNSTWKPVDEAAVASAWRACEGAGCVVAYMKQSDATAPAIAATAEFEGQRYLAAFEEMGRVDLGKVVYPGRSDAKEAPVLLNGTPSLVTTELASLDISGVPNRVLSGLFR
jgi:2-keto-3-deoxy-L-rhamnonate aldolase RhmA